MWFGNRISSPIHLTTVTIPIQNQKCLKNASNFPLAIWSAAETLSSLQMHSPAAQNNSVFAGTAIQAPRTNSIKKSPSFTIFLLPIHKFRGAGLSEEQCLCVNCPVVNKIHKYEICVVLGCVFCVFKDFLFWIGIVKVVRWIGLEILIPKHMQKS